MYLYLVHRPRQLNGTCGSGGANDDKLSDRSIHRRAGNFFTRGGGGGGGGGAVKHLPKKFSQVAQIFTKKSKRNEGHIRCSNIGLLTK